MNKKAFIGWIFKIIGLAIMVGIIYFLFKTFDFKCVLENMWNVCRR